MKGRVLIIDDDREYSHSLRQQLATLGYEVLAEPNNVSGIQAAEAFAPSVIITDTIGGGAFKGLRENRTDHPHTAAFVDAQKKSIENRLRPIHEGGRDHLFRNPPGSRKLKGN